MYDHDNKTNQQSGGTAVATPPEEKAENQVQEAQPEAERASFLPAVDIVDGESETVLFMDVPGVDKDGVDISIDQDIMTIRAKPAEDKEFAGCELVYAEYRVGDYKRSFSLSENVNRDGIKAVVRDGVLQITLPKQAPVTKKITVSAS